MILKMLSYYDKKMNLYTSPITIDNRSNEDLIEMFRRFTCSKEFNPVYLDFDIYCLGTFDDKTASLVLEDKPVYLASFSDFALLRKEVLDDGKEEN